MLSTRLVSLIESHWEEIASRLIRALRSNPEMECLAKQPDIELREWCQEILEHLGYLLSAPKDDEVRRRFEVLGRVRFEEHVPLHEAVLRLQILKDKILGFMHEQSLPVSGIQLYAERELEQRTNRFFDALIYHIVHGYEMALRRNYQAAS